MTLCHQKGTILKDHLISNWNLLSLKTCVKKNESFNLQTLTPLLKNSASGNYVLKPFHNTCLFLLLKMNYFAPLLIISFSSVVFCCEINLPSPKTLFLINAPTKKTICFHSDSVVIVKDSLFKLHQSEKTSHSNNVM